MHADRLSIAALTLFALPASAFAAAQQTPPQGPPTGTLPDNPYARPPDMAPNERAVDSANEQMRRGLLEADRVRAAKAARSGGRARAAKAGEVVPGAAVADRAGTVLGTIDAIEPDGAVIGTAAGKVKVPLEAFGKNRNGLLLDIGKADFDEMVLQANSAPPG